MLRAPLLFRSTCIALLMLAGLATGSIAARESRPFNDSYTLEVGFETEPAMQGDTNGLWLKVMKGDTPVEGLEGTLEPEVQFGETIRILPLAPVPGQPGTYTSIFIPIQPGDYTFHIRGEIDGTRIDESFASGQNGMPRVLTRAEYEFPVAAHGFVEKAAMPVAVSAIGLAIFLAQRLRAATRS